MGVLDSIVEWASEIGDLSYQALPDPSPLGIQIRLRVQSIKEALGASPVTVDMPLWAHTVCTDIDAPHGPQQELMLRAWAACEGGLGHGNPFNVAAPLDHRWAWNGQTGFWNDLGDGYGVAIFASAVDGAAACALNLLNHPYNDIIRALRTGDVALFANTPDLATWGTGNACVKAALGVA